ncbi:MAG: hypothetical protein IT449_08705 [Phycisphaerales bacterium]|nr:hypothetical protein [Phycisphaerales bacterium]
MLQLILLGCVLPALSGAALLVLATGMARWRKSRRDPPPPDPVWRWTWGAAMTLVLGASLLMQEGLPDGSSIARWHAILPAAAATALAGAASSMSARPRIGACAGPIAAAVAVGGLAWLLPDMGGIAAILTVLGATALATAAAASDPAVEARDSTVVPHDPTELPRGANPLAAAAHSGALAVVFAGLAALSLQGRFAKLALICAALAGFCVLGALVSLRLRVGVSSAALVASTGIVACCAVTGFAYTGDDVPAWCWLAALAALPAGRRVGSVARGRGFSRGRALAAQSLVALLLAVCGWGWLSLAQARQGDAGQDVLDAAYR